MSSSKTLSVVIPGLWWDNEGDFDFVYSRAKIPNLLRLLHSSKLRAADYLFSDYLYRDLFISVDNLAVNLAHKIGVYNAQRNYMLLEAVNFRLDRDQFIISSAQTLAVDSSEITQIIELVNQHFVGEFTVYYYSNDWCLLETNQDISGVKTYPVIDICGKNIANYLPTGNNVLYWHKVMNEIQMLLYGCKVNQNRQKSNLLEISSLWLWDIPASACSLSLDLVTSEQLAIPSQLLVRGLFFPNRYQDEYSYTSYLEQLDTQLFNLLLENRAKFDKILIIDPAYHKKITVEIDKFAWVKFWQHNTLRDIKEYK